MTTATHPEHRGPIRLAGGLIAAAAVTAYHNSFSGPFVFDDLGSIPENPTIRHLWPPWGALSPPPSLTVTGRPLLNLSLAVNDAISGLHPWSYHALNLAIHILAGLTLFGIVRRTLDVVRHRHATGLAFAIALLWTVHPLQTESVTYIIQRAESLMGLLYLLTLYCFIRYVSAFPPQGGAAAEPAAGKGIWAVLSVLACLLGMAAKEVIVSAPVIVFLYDRTFCAGSFREAWRARRGYYLALGSTWILLAWLVAGAGDRGGSAGFDTVLPWWAYARVQCVAVAHYLWLALWPRPLVFYYGRAMGGSAARFAIDLAIVVVLAAATAAALWRRPAWGFLGACFFAILAPSSSVVPVATETIAEHRMYLALAPVIAVVVLGVIAAAGRRLGTVLLLAWAVGLTGATLSRNAAYQSSLRLWADTVTKLPGNGTAHNNLGEALRTDGRLREAKDQFDEALRLDPAYADAYNNRGITLTELGRPAAAISDFAHALRIQPHDAKAHLNWGDALEQQGAWDEAIAQYEEAGHLEPDRADTHFDLGKAFMQRGRLAEAVSEFQQTLRINPIDAEACNNLGVALADLGRLAEARTQFAAALRIRLDYPVARANLARVEALLPAAPSR